MQMVVCCTAVFVVTNYCSCQIHHANQHFTMISKKKNMEDEKKEDGKKHIAIPSKVHYSSNKPAPLRRHQLINFTVHNQPCHTKTLLLTSNAALYWRANCSMLLSLRLSLIKICACQVFLLPSKVFSLCLTLYTFFSFYTVITLATT